MGITRLNIAQRPLIKVALEISEVVLLVDESESAPGKAKGSWRAKLSRPFSNDPLG
ncbi:MAG: hypothetical protein ACI9D0_002080 [Bacteroidia bacterium]|jgi:hypothetical protein